MKESEDIIKTNNITTEDVMDMTFKDITKMLDNAIINRKTNKYDCLESLQNIFCNLKIEADDSHFSPNRLRIVISKKFDYKNIKDCFDFRFELIFNISLSKKTDELSIKFNEQELNIYTFCFEDSNWNIGEKIYRQKGWITSFDSITYKNKTVNDYINNFMISKETENHFYLKLCQPIYKQRFLKFRAEDDKTVLNYYGLKDLEPETIVNYMFDNDIFELNSGI